MAACPLKNPIPQALRALADGDVAGATALFRQRSALREVCARVCPREQLCEGACVLGQHGAPVAVSALEQFATEQAPPPPIYPPPP